MIIVVHIIIDDVVFVFFSFSFFLLPWCFLRHLGLLFPFFEVEEYQTTPGD